jgi:protein-S-isoprenylcysteine O-methyltransferase Ste14
MFLTDPWFWAFISTFGWFLGPIILGAKIFRNRIIFSIICITLVEIPRIVLPLPFVVQPRFQADSIFATIAGGIILVISLAFGTASFRIRPLTPPNRAEPFRRDGLYAIVRHPVMLCDAFWPLGWSLIWNSVTGAFLTLAWFTIAYLITFLEEEKLVQEYGEEYARYQQEVPRIVPFVRWL